MVNISRRTAILATLSVASPALASCATESHLPELTFAHGVASGDPTQNSVILWTRLTSSTQDPVRGQWQISTSPNFARFIRKGEFSTNADRDFTVKIDAQRLSPGKTYYYRFTAANQVSPVGSTKTLPEGSIDQARFAIVSCTNYPFGFFNVYDHIAKNLDFDAVIHLGDYFYEYGRDGYGGKTGAKIGREHEPAHEIISLKDYRTRHAQYKSDLSAQAMHAAHAMICIWDDHETANDSWKSGAENHNEGEGNWDDRRAKAMQAYYEWMPVRDPQVGQPREALFKSYSFGDLLTLVSIETRLTARSRPLDYAQHIPAFQTREGVGNFIQNILGDPAREMMGAAQRAYVSAALKQSKDNGQSWRLVANQTLIARINSPDLTDYKGTDIIDEVAKSFPAVHDYIALSPLGLPLSLDSWDGYPAARERFYQLLQAQNVQDIVVLTGDSHEFWANTLETADGQSMGIELGTAGVTSPGTGEYFGETGEDYSRRLVAKNPDIVYHNLKLHGYIDLKLGQTDGQANFIGVDTVLSPDYSASIVKTIFLSRSKDSVTID